MSNIVSKLIHNALIQSGNVALPYLGSLRIEGDPKRVVFDDEVHDGYPSIINIIAFEGKVSRDEAERLYGDWLASAKESDGSIFIDGVGRINPRQMDIDSTFNKALNGASAPLPTATLKKRKKSGWVWWVLVLLLLLGGGAAWYLQQDENTLSEPQEEVAVANEEAEEIESTLADPPSRAEAVCGTPEKMKEATKAIKAENVEATEKSATPPAPNKRYNVAVGVYSIKWNAEDCVRKDPLGIGSENYLIGRFPSNLWVVIAHSTDDWREAEKMRKTYKKIQKDVWVYRRY